MKSTPLFLVSVSLLIIQGVFLSPGYAVSEAVILSTSNFRDFIGYYHIVGEVQNTGDVALSSVKITATLYTASQEVVSTIDAYTVLDVILPGRKSPFEIFLTDIGQSARVNHYSLDLQYTVHEPPFLIGLEILSDSSYEDPNGWYRLEGEIKNVGANTATAIKVAATFYGETGTVVAVAATNLNPSILDPNGTATFELILVYTSRVDLITSYSLSADSEQYAIIREFPWLICTTILIGLALTAQILCLKLEQLLN